MEKMEKQELISALADGQLRGEAFAAGVEAAGSDPKALAAWQSYHLIGDVLRSGELALRSPGTGASEFLARFQLRLEQETLPSPQSVQMPLAAMARRATPSLAANDPSLRWKMVAGFASLAAVGAIGWTVVAGGAMRADQAQLASAQPVPGVVAAGNERPVMIRDPRLDELLAAHRQFGATTALQMPAGFVRNATFDGSAR